MTDYIEFEIDDPIKALLKSQENFAVDFDGLVYELCELDSNGECRIGEVEGLMRIEFIRWSQKFENRIRKCLKPITKEV